MPEKDQKPKRAKHIPKTTTGLRWRRRKGRHGIVHIPEIESENMKRAAAAAAEMLGPFPVPETLRSLAPRRVYGWADPPVEVRTLEDAQREVRDLVRTFRRNLELAEETPRPREFVDLVTHLATSATQLSESLKSLSWYERLLIGNAGPPTMRHRDLATGKKLRDYLLPVARLGALYELPPQTLNILEEAAVWEEPTDRGPARAALQMEAWKKGLLTTWADPRLPLVRALPVAPDVSMLAEHRPDGFIVVVLDRMSEYLRWLAKEIQWDVTRNGAMPLDAGGNTDIAQRVSGTPTWILASDAWSLFERCPRLRPSKARKRGLPEPAHQDRLADLGVHDRPSLPAFLDLIVEAATDVRSADREMFARELKVWQAYRPKIHDLETEALGLRLGGKGYDEFDVWVYETEPRWQWMLVGSEKGDAARVPEHVRRRLKTLSRKIDELNRAMEEDKHIGRAAARRRRRRNTKR